MKIIQRLVTVLSVILACVVIGSLLVLPTENAQAQSNSAPSPKLSDSIPVNPNPSIYPNNPEKAFGNFAWETFVALNWPADCSNGSPKGEKIGQDPDAPRVWEFYQYPEDIFKPNGEKPNLKPVIPPQCRELRNLSQSVARNLRITELASNEILQSLIKSDPSLSILEVGNVPLVDRTRNYIINEARMNPVEVGQIVSNGWYSADKLAQFNNQFDNEGNPFQLMCSAKAPYGIYPAAPSFLKVPCSDNGSEGVIELKAAWMVFPDPVPENLQSEYYTTKRTFYVQTPEDADGEETKVTAPLGLVGFHILHKTSQRGWIWATFEHIDNAPDATSLPAPGYYNLYDQDCTGNCEVNTPLATAPYLWRDEFPHAVTKEDGEIKEQTPSQITRLVSITPIAQSLNSEWQKALAAVPHASVWQNYQLIGVQWLQNPYVPYETGVGGRQVTPAQLANVTLEPYVQKGDPGNSCIACHSLAALPPLPKYPPDLKNLTCADPQLENSTCADFSFLMGHAESSSSQARK